MTESEIEDAIREALEDVAGLPTILWPNDATALPTLPYVVVEIVRFDPVQAQIAGKHALTGLLQASVLIAQGRYNSEAKAYADLIVAAFPAGTSIAAGDGSITVTRRPAILSGYEDPAINAWRTPVQVAYRGFD